MTRYFVVVACFSLALAGCGEDSVSPTSPTTTTAAPTQYFTGSVVVGGSRFFSFTNTTTGTGTFLLASVTSASGVPVSSVLGLGTGIPAGTGCAVSESVETSGTLQVQHTRVFPPGIYCVSVWDLGQLTSDVNFALRFTHP